MRYNADKADTTRWNLVVSRNTDDSLRQFLANQGRSRKGELSRFVEEAVQAYILDVAAGQAEARNANLSEAEISEAVGKAMEWARRS